MQSNAAETTSLMITDDSFTDANEIQKSESFVKVQCLPKGSEEGSKSLFLAKCRQEAANLKKSNPKEFSKNELNICIFTKCNLKRYNQVYKFKTFLFL